MDDERISRLLRNLPRDEASPHFTAGVLRRTRDVARAHRQPGLGLGRRLVLAVSLAVLLAASVWGVRAALEDRAHDRERQAALARLETLEAQKQALEDEIRHLRRLARDAQPVIYLGSTPRLDVVVDLRRLAERRSPRPGTVRPAHGPDPASTRFVTDPRR